MSNPPNKPRDDRRMHEGDKPGLDPDRSQERAEEPVDLSRDRSDAELDESASPAEPVIAPPPD